MQEVQSWSDIQSPLQFDKFGHHLASPCLRRSTKKKCPKEMIHQQNPQRTSPPARTFPVLARHQLRRDFPEEGDSSYAVFTSDGVGQEQMTICRPWHAKSPGVAAMSVWIDLG